MKRRICAILLSCILSCIMAIAAADGSKFSTGISLLEEGSYKTLFGKNALDSFKDAYKQTPAQGPKIAQALVAYSQKLASEDKYVSNMNEDAHSVLNDALQFDGTIRDQVIQIHLKYLSNLIEYRKYSAAHKYCVFLNEYGAGKDAYELIANYERQLKENVAIEDYENIYTCLSKTLGNDVEQKLPLINHAAEQAINILRAEGASKSFEFSNAICELIDEKICKESLERQYRSVYQDSITQGNTKDALKILDEIKYYSSETFTNDDKGQLKNLINIIIGDYDGDYATLYNNFKLILSLHYFDGLDFKFLTNNYDLDAEVTVFGELRVPEETAYFYYDTGRILSGSRGILITDENLYYQNFMGDPAKVALNDIETVALTYEKGVSLTGWKLRINDDENLDVRLSRIDDEAIIPFIASIIYLINLNNDLNEISLYIPESEQHILDGSIWERHKGEIVTAAVVATAAITYALTQNTQQMQSAKIAAAEITRSVLSKSKNVLASSYRQVNTAYKKAHKSMKEEGRGFIKSLKTFEFKDRSGNTIAGKLGDFYDKGRIVKMPYVGGSNKSQSARGYLRDKKLFWNLFQEKGAEALSKNNLERISQNQSPIVDQKWVDAYPTHKNFMGETLEHHHLNHGGKAIPLPQSLHRIGINHEKWHGPKD